MRSANWSLSRKLRAHKVAKAISQPAIVVVLFIAHSGRDERL